MTGTDDMEVVCVTLHKDGSFGVMFRDNGRLLCTCGWNEDDRAEQENRLIHSEEPA